MMPGFRSSLAQPMRDLTTFKRLEGFDYTTQANFLRHFDTFLSAQEYDRASLDREVVEAYIAHTATLVPHGRYGRLSVVRVFSRYLHQSDPESYVLHELPVRRPRLPRWYLYSPEDIAAVLRQSRALRPVGSLRPSCMHMLVGLLYVSGLRIGEALALNLGDVDIAHASLLVRKGKFGKQRYVALDRSTIQAVEAYLARRTTCEPTSPGAPLFLTPSGHRLRYCQVAGTFRRLVQTCGVGHDAPRLPRLHDLRHTYACTCLLKWYDEGADVTSKLPILASAMGHVKVEATQIYLHITSRLLEQGARRFRDTFAANCARGADR